MKGRIIGREGRNIRALETATGVDLIIDDTPEAVILSGFDPVRREIARVVARAADRRRPHPPGAHRGGRREGQEGDRPGDPRGRRAGLLELGVHDLHPELSSCSGGCSTAPATARTSSSTRKEVAFLAGMMAAELGLNVKLAKRAGLLHDIGKAIDHEIEGTHLELGVEVADASTARPRRSSTRWPATTATYEPATRSRRCWSTAADALSAARPGARREVLETYVKRLEKLEEIATGFKGVRRRTPSRPAARSASSSTASKVTDERVALAVEGHRQQDRGRS